MTKNPSLFIFHNLFWGARSSHPKLGTHFILMLHVFPMSGSFCILPSSSHIHIHLICYKTQPNLLA